jgi:peptidoglycan/xylan/chitin deacetylase (PgdA/CDA1 family)
MGMWTKLALLYAVKFLGGFALARLLTRRGLRILCWHGFSRADEHLFAPQLFITLPTFRRRVAWLKKSGLPILALDEAVCRLSAGTLPAGATVLTLDDGWASWSDAEELLRGLPVTGYVMTCYVDRSEPIFNLLARYAYYHSGKSRLCLAVGELTYDELWSYARGLTLDERAALLPEVARAGGVDLDRIGRERWFGLLCSAELKALGWDIQLHTHLHEWSRDAARVAQELAINTERLRHVAPGPLNHFCYPAGEYYPENFAQLSQLGIRSATTCNGHFNYQTDNPLALGRILDCHAMPQIVFEAAVSGVLEVARWVARRRKSGDLYSALGAPPIIPH